MVSPYVEFRTSLAQERLNNQRARGLTFISHRPWLFEPPEMGTVVLKKGPGGDALL